jgi:hypothetical protein
MCEEKRPCRLFFLTRRAVKIIDFENANQDTRALGSICMHVCKIDPKGAS